jgi:hypothetical protein
MSTTVRSYAFTAVLLFAAAGTARADSFMTSISFGSAKAAKIGPKPYSNTPLTEKQSSTIVKRAVKLTRGRDLAAAMDAVRIVDSAAMDNAGLAVDFKAGLQAAARRGTVHERFLDGYSLMVRDPGNAQAAELVRGAAREAPDDSALQLGAFQAIAQRAFFGGMDKPETVRLAQEAAGLLKRAQKLEQTNPRPEVAEGLRQAFEYAKLYPELNAALQ